jgi:hypothetical protein
MTYLFVLAMPVELWMRWRGLGDDDENDMESMRGNMKPRT